MTAAGISAIDAALRYAALGFHLIPVRGKIPWMNGGPMTEWQKLATDDIATVRKWWTDQPTANIGIAPDGTFAILDNDCLKGGDETIAAIEQREGPLPETVMSRSGGGGMHLYYKAVAGRPLVYKPGKGVEILGPGRQAVEWPSVHPDTGKLYEWIPGHAPWECDMADAPNWFYADTAESKRKTNGHAAGGSFFGQVNGLALRRIDDWIETLFPTAKRSSNGAWRVRSADLGRNLEEDVSFHPTEGAFDFGRERRYSPLEAVQEYRCLGVVDAAMLLCEWLGTDPESLGWKHAKRGRREEPPPHPGPEAKGHDAPHQDDAPPQLSPGAPLDSARELIARQFTRDGRRTIHHRAGVFHVWAGTHYPVADDATIRAGVWHFLDTATRWDPEEEAVVPFKPTAAKVANVIDALKAAANLDSATVPPAWLDETAGLPPAELIACTNGLLHLSTRRLTRHSPSFFNQNALEFPHDPDALDPVEWLRFLDTLWPEDGESIAALQELFGYALSTDTK
jgi:hypothetical protein